MPTSYDIVKELHKDSKADVKYYKYMFAFLALVALYTIFDIFRNVKGDKIENVPFYLKKSDAELERERKIEESIQ